MKFIIRLLAFCFLFELPSMSQAQSDEKICLQAKQIISQLETYHLQSRILDNRLSAEIFDAFLERLDPSGYFFLEQDIEQLSIYRHRIDEQIQSQNCAFVRKTSELFKARLEYVDKLIHEIGDQPFNLTTPASRTTSPEIIRAKDLEELKQRWSKQLRDRTLSFIYREATSLPEGEELIRLESENRGKAMTRIHCRLQRLINITGGLDEYVGKVFLNTLAKRYDPHTVYFSAAGRSAFEGGLAKEGYSFGFDLEENDKAELQISVLQPGGPAWKSHLLNDGDIVMHVRVDGGKEVDLICAHADEVSRQLLAAHVTQVELEVKKKNGQLRKVVLVKEKIAVQDNVINSFVLEGEKKVGYIYLPGFYTNWEGAAALGLSNDVAKELLKLQMEGIEGLILDLRHNSGGAIIEALGLAGIFIDVGPLAIGKDATGALDILKDMNRGMAYGGPLVILVDGMSASASEIFAAAMQDYKRAVIVGDTTYGKSSGQQFIPVDERRPASGGDLKVTMQKYYRITGNTYQRQGVVPDVALPQLLSAWVPSEKDDPVALNNDQVDKQLKFQTFPDLPIEALAQKSKARLTRDQQFLQIRTASDSLYANLSKQEKMPLDAGGYFSYRRRLSRQMERLMVLEERKTALFETKNNRFAESLVQMSEIQKLNNESLIRGIQHDIYIAETFQIMLDLIKSK